MLMHFQVLRRDSSVLDVRLTFASHPSIPSAEQQKGDRSRRQNPAVKRYNSAGRWPQGSYQRHNCIYSKCPSLQSKQFSPLQSPESHFTRGEEGIGGCHKQNFPGGAGTNCENHLYWNASNTLSVGAGRIREHSLGWNMPRGWRRGQPRQPARFGNCPSDMRKLETPL